MNINNKKKLGNTTPSSIQWFPGHMAKARRLVQENLKLVDVVIELLDARIPLSSRNPMINEILKKKPRLVVLNKADLADPLINIKWQQTFEATDNPETGRVASIAVDAVKGKGFAEIPTLLKMLVAEQMARLVASGRRSRPVRCMVLGIPNVGKSSFINRISRRKVTETADKPGVTKGKQMIKIHKDLELLDTPGILWPKFEDVEVGLKLAATGAIKEQIIDVEQVALYLLAVLMQVVPENLISRYKLNELPSGAGALLTQIGAKRGLLRSGGTIDSTKTAVLVLKEYRAGMLGRVSLESPPES
ncbi:MAG: ribosome biogenesis GTPase YlqF [Desulfotomaculum sp.]|nr:ribosome biogenesis GTPase YlqF [Desulfotomaculum sp.]